MLARAAHDRIFDRTHMADGVNESTLETLRSSGPSAFCPAQADRSRPPGRGADGDAPEPQAGHAIWGGGVNKEPLMHYTVPGMIVLCPWGPSLNVHTKADEYATAV